MLPCLPKFHPATRQVSRLRNVQEVARRAQPGALAKLVMTLPLGRVHRDAIGLQTAPGTQYSARSDRMLGLVVVVEARQIAALLLGLKKAAMRAIRTHV